MARLQKEITEIQKATLAAKAEQDLGKLEELQQRLRDVQLEMRFLEQEVNSELAAARRKGVKFQ